MDIAAIFLGLVILALPYMTYRIGYNRGRVDGAEWANDVHRGKYDTQIEKEFLEAELKRMGYTRIK